MLAVAQDDISDISDTESVDQDIADLDFLADESAVFGEFEHITGVEDEDILLAVAHLAGNLCLRLEVAELAVDRDGISGLYQMVDQLDVFLAGMAGCVNILCGDIGALQQEFVDDGSDRLFVARNGTGGEDNRISGADGHFAVHTVRHAAEGRHRLSLAAGRDDNGLLSRIVFELIDVDQGIFRDIEHVEFGSGLNDIDHAAAFDDNLPAVFVGMVDDLLNAVHVGGEGRDNDTSILVVAENLVDIPADCFLGRCMSGALRIGGVAHEGQHTFISQFGEALQIDGVAVNRRIIHLEIACVYDRARGGLDGQGSGIHNTVIGLDEFDIKFSQFHNVAEGDNVKFCHLEQVVLAELVFDDAHRQTRPVHGDIDLFQNIGKGADMIFMAMGDDKCLHLIYFLFQIRGVRNDQIDPEHVVLRECKAAVHDHNAVPVLKRSDVHADLLQTPERNDP